MSMAPYSHLFLPFCKSLNYFSLPISSLADPRDPSPLGSEGGHERLCEGADRWGGTRWWVRQGEVIHEVIKG